MFLRLGVEVLLDVRDEPARIDWQTDDLRTIGEFFSKFLHGNQLVPRVAEILTAKDAYVRAFEFIHEFGEKADLELVAVDLLRNLLSSLIAGDQIPPFVRDPGQILHDDCLAGIWVGRLPGYPQRPRSMVGLGKCDRLDQGLVGTGRYEL
jgi:hypothetical protein